jgi:hypothetical protein
MMTKAQMLTELEQAAQTIHQIRQHLLKIELQQHARDGLLNYQGIPRLVGMLDIVGSVLLHLNVEIDVRYHDPDEEEDQQ